jgi:hypothetical protein
MNASELKQLSERAARYAVNRNGTVKKSNGPAILSGGCADVYKGVMTIEQHANLSVDVAIKSIRGAQVGEKELKVRTLRYCHCRC